MSLRWRGDPGADDVDQAGEAALLILLGKPGDLGLDRRLGLALDEIGGREIDEDEEGQHRGREQREIKRGKAKGVGPQQPDHVYSARKRIAGAAHGVQQRPGEAFIDLLPQPAHMHVDDVGLRVEVIVPDILEQHRAGHHLTGVAHEEFEQAELARQEFDLLARRAARCAREGPSRDRRP